MAKSEKAKALEAQQKAALKAEKLRKKTSDNPADWGRWRQYKEVYKRTAEVDPKLNLYLGLAALAGIVIAVLLGILLQAHWAVIAVLAILMALLGLLLVLTRRAKAGTIARYQGQAGSAEVAMSMLNNKKYTYTSAIAFTRDMDMVHRVIGPSGVVLIGEGQPARVRTLLGQEQKRHQQVLFGIPVQTMVMGDGTGQVKLADLQKTIEKLPKAIQPAQQTAAQTKLKSLDAVRPKAPLPKGPLPAAKGMNRAMRGR
ncbi:DUF4191 domain-containing protein [Propioniciclava tarda]|uniref:DUF4191 family protein n=1 Tax=Propioniciclava tarda TaxID=433330 RepID=A0A4Q9KK40_PROTD|nr:DUF4191 domain-containing protein [Propioniciclava tarda]TBT94694.1 DUF4191 family protein [Propioniciclava tarda]SMO65658.1 protein of unknown function [Propioniciclava tarda]HOA87781.1 DUF4191 domain-containing protein [Propioniciclava tarda]HQA29838.1 DUF4191 domain-containing protein [Propioniciclava tarda]HQD59745.1 DUF4191 domain-containing protein [Propioniciclava tarda]